MIQGLLGYQALNATAFTDIDVNVGEVDFSLSSTTHPEVNLGINITLNDSKTNSYEIVGVYEKAAGETEEEIYFSERSYIEDILAATTFSASAKVLYTSVGNEVIEQVINIMYDNGFTFESLNSEEIINYGERITIMKSAFLIASIFMAIYSLVLMYYFISQMITDKKTDIGILKALGCSKKDIARIFVLCSASIALIIFLITVLFTFAVAAITNIVVVSQIPVSISVFTTSGLMYLWLAVMCAAVVAVGTAIPITKYSKLPPKELLKIF
jgi:putative ABC transport system permease protein